MSFDSLGFGTFYLLNLNSFFMNHFICVFMLVNHLVCTHIGLPTSILGNSICVMALIWLVLLDDVLSQFLIYYLANTFYQFMRTYHELILVKQFGMPFPCK